MTRPLRMDFPGALHHAMNRGVQRRDIFVDDVDRRLFMKLLGDACITYHWSIHAYTLMTNHFHLVVETHEATLSRGMQQLTGDYADAFNRRHGRDGHLFKGRFKSHLVQKETYLLELARYVVLNPVRAGLVQHAADWKWSSYGATAGLTRAEPWLETDAILELFDRWDREAARRLYAAFVAEGHTRARPLWGELVANFFLGSTEFIEKLRERFPLSADGRETSRKQRRSRAVDISEVKASVERAFAATIAQRNWRSETARAAFAQLARREALAPWTAIGDVLGMSGPGARQLARRCKEMEERDPSFREVLDHVRLTIGLSRR